MTHVCKSCGATLEVECGDVTPGKINGSYCESGDDAWFINCGFCKRRTLVPDSFAGFYDREADIAKLRENHMTDKMVKVER